MSMTLIVYDPMRGNLTSTEYMVLCEAERRRDYEKCQSLIALSMIRRFLVPRSVNGSQAIIDRTDEEHK